VKEGVFEFTIDVETKVVRSGDTMLKQDGILHGCVCLEKGILIDFFTPMRNDFVL
jgi:quercetin dioxygenase-like cupin family protein